MIFPSNRHAALCAAALLSASLTVQAQTATHWVGTWATAPMAAKNTSGKLGDGTDGYTLREIVHVSLGGPAVRVELTNEFGTEPLIVGDAQVALTAPDGAISAGSSVQLSFGGHTSVTIPVGAMVVSDPATIKVAPLSDLTVSLFLPDQTISQLSRHSFADQTNYLVPGNVVTANTLTATKLFYSWDFLKGIEVQADPDAAAIVTFGDSITDGAKSTRDKNLRWPDILAKRLQANKATAKLGVLNEGIGGNRLLHDNTGPNALARFDRDVIAQPGVKYLIFLEAINDIGHAYDPKKPYDVVTADDLIASYVQMARRAHEHGIKVYGATLTPYRGLTPDKGAGYSSPEGEAVRTTLNQWIRTSKELDGFIDFDKATRNASVPTAFAAFADSGDHLHPNDAGYNAMGESIDLKLFTK
jgi:lysophospholipase L1-like esterase